MRRIIFNADDFGITSGVNRSIVEAHARGVLTSATLMANAGATAEAIQLTRAHQTLRVGGHIVLVDGEPLTDPARLSSLTAAGSSRFASSVSGLAAKALSGRLDRDQIESEAIAQFRRLQDAGMSLTHFDTHKHAHMFPAVLEGLLRSARVCGIPALRNPFEPPQPFSTEVSRAWAYSKRLVQTRVLRLFQKQFQHLVKRAGLRTTDGTVGIAVTGSLEAAHFRRIIEDLPEGTWEFVCHPGYCDDDLRSARTRLLGSREVELQLLTAPETRELLARHKIELISYANL